MAKMEQAGFDTFTFPDSICYPKEGSDVYPYNDDGTREFLDGVPFLEPFVAIPYLAARTEKLRFTTSVVKLAIRQPLIVAKQLSTLGVMLGDRFGFGVGISPLGPSTLPSLASVGIAGGVASSTSKSTSPLAMTPRTRSRSIVKPTRSRRPPPPRHPPSAPRPPPPRVRSCPCNSWRPNLARPDDAALAWR